MATVTTRISPLWHGLPLLSSLAELRCVGPSTYEQARRHAGREACRSVVIMDGQSVKTTERGGARGFDAHKRVKGRKRHILVDTLGLPVANRVEPANTSDRRAGALLLGGLRALFPRIRTVIADVGHESRKLARTLKQHQGWQLRILKRRQPAFKITGLTSWNVALPGWGGTADSSKDYEYRMQTSETMIDLAAIRLTLNRIAPARDFSNTLLNNEVKVAFGLGNLRWKPRHLRSAYGAICCQLFKPKNMTEDIFLAQILGHKLLPGAAALSVGQSYKDFYVK